MTSRGTAATRRGQVLVLLVTTGGVLVLLQLLVALAGVSFADLTRDPAAIAGLPWYTGAVSLATGVLWFVGGALSLVATTGAAEPQARRLGLLGLLMVAFGAEDLFTLQETLTALSIPAGAYYVTYLLLGVAIAWQFRMRPYDSVTAVFVGGGLLLGASLAVDLLGVGPILVEDGAKLLGVLLWCLIPVWVLRERLRPAEDLAVS